MYLYRLMTDQPRQVRRTQADRSAETRVQLIRAATTLLHKIGFSGLTTANVAKEAGLTTGALHHHFPTKFELLFTVYDHLSERVLEDFTKQKNLASGRRLNVAKLVRYFWGVYGDPEYWAIWEILIGTRAEADVRPSTVSDRMDAIREVRYRWLEEHVDMGKNKREIFDLLEFTLIAIRGLSLERLFHKEEAYFERHLQTLTSVIAARYDALSGDISITPLRASAQGGDRPKK
jgi:AcrR family transcriptional regulator